jgi:hypothetical protein
MNQADVESALGRALELFLDQERYLLEVDASERSMSHRLAVYLAEVIPDYEVDCEYNRDGFNAKKLHLQPPETNAFDDDAVTVFPDIIVHKRGSNNDNLLVVEIKKANSRLGPQFDKSKLTAFRAQLNYKWAAHVVVGFVKGKLVNTIEWIDTDREADGSLSVDLKFRLE